MSDREKILRAIAWGCSCAGRLGEDLTPYFEAFVIAHKMPKPPKEAAE